MINYYHFAFLRYLIVGVGILPIVRLIVGCFQEGWTATPVKCSGVWRIQRIGSTT